MKGNKKLKQLTALIYLLLAGTLSSSCGIQMGGQEINRIAIVTSIALDYEDEEILVTCEVVNPTSSGNNPMEGSDGGANSNYFIYVQGRGRTVKEAIDDINLHLDKKIFLSHSNILIIGEELAKEDMTDLMDFFLRDNEPREDMYVVLAKGAKAYDIIGIRAGLGRASGSYLFDILNNFPYNARFKNITFAEKYRYFYDRGDQPVLSLVQVRETKQLDIELRNKEARVTTLDVTGGAAFKDGHLEGYFTGDEMIGFNFIVNHIRQGPIVFTSPKELKENTSIIGKDGSFTTVNILKSRTKKKIRVDGDKIHLIIDVKCRGELDEINQAIDIGKDETISMIEVACAERVKELISNTLDKGQRDFQLDSFGIGGEVHRQFPELWEEIGKDWKEIFPQLSYEINVKTTIVKSGLINTPANVRKRR